MSMKVISGFETITHYPALPRVGCRIKTRSQVDECYLETITHYPALHIPRNTWSRVGCRIKTRSQFVSRRNNRSRVVFRGAMEHSVSSRAPSNTRSRVGSRVKFGLESEPTARRPFSSAHRHLASLDARTFSLEWECSFRRLPLRPLH